MLFYGYIDNGKTFVKAKITADTAAEAYRKLERFADKVEEKFDEYRGNIECLMLHDENNKEICQSGDDINKKIKDYDSKFIHTLDGKIETAAIASKQQNNKANNQIMINVDKSFI